jgi:hypothetical protein
MLPTRRFVTVVYNLRYEKGIIYDYGGNNIDTYEIKQFEAIQVRLILVPDSRGQQGSAFAKRDHDNLMLMTAATTFLGLK